MSIIGNPIMAGKSLKAFINVTAKADALLNLHYKDSSIILQSYQLRSSETQHAFNVDVSDTAYVIEDATNGKSVEVLVDVFAVFNVKIFYGTYLFQRGDQCNSFTGGWNTGTTDTNISASVGYTLYSVSKGRYLSYDWGAFVYTANAIDWSKYSTLNVLVAYGTQSNNPDAMLQAGFTSVDPSHWNDMQKSVNISSYLSVGATDFTITFNISDITTTRQLLLLARSNTPQGYGDVCLEAHFSEVWIE